jgi:hypothetical protein
LTGAMKLFVRTLVFIFVIGFAASRSPAPVIEAPEVTPTPEQKVTPTPRASAEQKAPQEKEPPKAKRKKKEEVELKPEKTTPPPAKQAKPVSASPSGGFAGTWKGKMTDGVVWTIVIDPAQSTATAYGPLNVDGGAAQVQGSTISWSHLTKHQNNKWSLTLQSGGRRADVVAYHISGNMYGTFDKTN